MYKTKRYKTKRYKTKRYKTKRYKTKRYKKARGLEETKCEKIMGKCFRGKCGECMGCFQLLNNEDNPNYIFNKQHKIYEDGNPFIPEHILKREAPLTKPPLKREKRFKISKTIDAKLGRDIASQILKEEEQKF
jgi:hypothetical protein